MTQSPRDPSDGLLRRIADPSPSENRRSDTFAYEASFISYPPSWITSLIYLELVPERPRGQRAFILSARPVCRGASARSLTRQTGLKWDIPRGCHRASLSLSLARPRRSLRDANPRVGGHTGRGRLSARNTKHRQVQHPQRHRETQQFAHFMFSNSVIAADLISSLDPRQSILSKPGVDRYDIDTDHKMHEV